MALANRPSLSLICLDEVPTLRLENRSPCRSSDRREFNAGAPSDNAGSSLRPSSRSPYVAPEGCRHRPLPTFSHLQGVLVMRNVWNFAVYKRCLTAARSAMTSSLNKRLAFGSDEGTPLQGKLMFVLPQSEAHLPFSPARLVEMNKVSFTVRIRPISLSPYLFIE